MMVEEDNITNKKSFDKGYNERLFSKGFRKKLHMGRYEWLLQQMEKYDCFGDTMLELGCFDAKTLDFLPKQPKKYLGYDANWENGLDLGREKWKDNKDVTLLECQTADEMDLEANAYDISVSLETMEHIFSKDIEAYVKKLAFATKKYCFISVPNEKGPLFLTKHLTKKIMNNHQEDYTLPEYFYATIGNLKKVKRNEGGHKGFDYDFLASLVGKYFPSVEVMGIPFYNLPTSLNFSVGIIGKKEN